MEESTNIHNRDIVPRPDPTRLTTEQSVRLREEMHREISALRDLIMAKIENVMAEIQRSSAAAAAVNEEKFLGMAKQFIERDTRLDVALSAQKELVGAANTGFIKEIDSLKTLLYTNTNSINDKIGALSSRVDRGESGFGGALMQKDEQRSDNKQMMTFIGLVFLGVSVIIAALTLAFHAGPLK